MKKIKDYIIGVNFLLIPLYANCIAELICKMLGVD